VQLVGTLLHDFMAMSRISATVTSPIELHFLVQAKQFVQFIDAKNKARAGGLRAQIRLRASIEPEHGYFWIRFVGGGAYLNNCESC